MKLSCKLLTTVAPITIVGISIPTIASCSCSQSNYSINYGEVVNCRNQNESNYHNVDEVANAIKQKSNKQPECNITSNDLVNINNAWNTEIGKQSLYYDVVASIVITNKDTIYLHDWKIDSNQILTFVMNDVVYNAQNGRLQYKQQENKLWIYYLETKICKSYTYSDCTYVEG